MASRRRFKKKRAYRFKRKLKRGKGALAKRIPNVRRLFRQKILAQLTLVAPANPTTNGLYQYKNSYPLNFPGHYTDNDAVYRPITDDGVSRRTALTNSLGVFMQLFDQYKVLSLTVHYIPHATITGESSIVNRVNAQSTVMYSKDLDDVALFSDYYQSLVAGVKPLTATKPFKIIMKNPLKGRWFNCQSYNLTPTSDVTVNTSMPENPFSSIKLFVDNIFQSPDDPNDLGRIFLTWDVIFRGVNTAMPVE